MHQCSYGICHSYYVILKIANMPWTYKLVICCFTIHTYWAFVPNATLIPFVPLLLLVSLLMLLARSFLACFSLSLAFHLLSSFAFFSLSLCLLLPLILTYLSVSLCLSYVSSSYPTISNQCYYMLCYYIQICLCYFRVLWVPLLLALLVAMHRDTEVARLACFLLYYNFMITQFSLYTITNHIVQYIWWCLQ